MLDSSNKELTIPNLLISGPAGAGKSQAAARLRAESPEPTALAEHQELYAAVLGLRRDPATGRYPERDPRDAWALPMAEYLRRVIITSGQDRGFDVITTNSDGDPERRELLVMFLGPGATEIVMDPGESIIRDRLTFGMASGPSAQCEEAMDRWFRRLPNA